MKFTLWITTVLLFSLNITACSENKSVEEYLQYAAAYSSNKNFSSAIIELKNAARLEPKNPQIRFRLGSAYLEQGILLSAEKELELALRMSDEQSLILPKLAKTKMQLNKYDEVYAMVKKSINFANDPYLEILTYAGLSALKNRDKKTAEDYISQAQEIDKNSKYALLGLGWLEFANNNYAEVSNIIKQIKSEFPTFSDVLLLTGYLNQSQKKYDIAIEAFEQLTSIHPQLLKPRLLSVYSLILDGKFDDAKTHVNHLLIQKENHPTVNYYNALIQFNEKEYEQAKSSAQKALDNQSDFVGAGLVAGISAFQLKDFEQSYHYLQKINNSLPINHPAKKFIIATNLLLGNTERAADILSKKEMTETDVALLQITSAEMAEIGNFSKAFELITDAETLAPDNASVKTQKGLLLLSENKVEGIEELAKALELNPELYSVKANLVIILLKQNKDVEALKLIKEMQTIEDSVLLGHLLEGILYTKQNQLELAKKKFKQIIDIAPENTAALYNLAIFAVKDKQLELAVGILKQVLSIIPEHSGAINQLSMIKIEQNDIDSHIEFLKSLLKNNPKNRSLIVGLAQNLKINNQIHESIALLETIADETDLTTGYWLLSGDNYLQIGDIIKAKQSYQNIIETNSTNFIAYIRLIGIYQLEKQYKKGIIFTESALKIFKDNPRLSMLKANFEILIGDHDKAFLTIKDLQSNGVKHHYLNNLIGKLAFADKDYSKAIINFELLYEKQPTSMNALKLSRSLKFNGQKEEAALLLEHYIKHQKDDNNIRMLLAELYREFDIGNAIKHFEILNTKLENNLIILNELALLELKNNRTQKALFYSEKAMKLKPNTPQIMDTYGAALVSAGNFDSAINVLESAIDLGGREISTYINLTKAYLEKGYKSRAVDLLKKIDDIEASTKIKELLKS